MKIGFVSLGCAKNLVDSEYIIGLFDDPFFEYEQDLKKCDAIVINTCGFIQSAKEETIDTILEIAESELLISLVSVEEVLIKEVLTLVSVSSIL